MSKLMTNEYADLLAEVKERVRAAQYTAFRAVNKELVALYWDIGRMISERQVTGMHGDAVVEQLASDLRMEFPGVGGFSRRNVFYMWEFYIAYRDLPKVQPLVAQIGWTQNLSARFCTLYPLRLTTYGQLEMVQDRLEECVWSPHGKGSSHSKAEWGRHPGPKRMVFSAGVNCGLKSELRNN